MESQVKRTHDNIMSLLRSSSEDNATGHVSLRNEANQGEESSGEAMSPSDGEVRLRQGDMGQPGRSQPSELRGGTRSAEAVWGARVKG